MKVQKILTALFLLCVTVVFLTGKAEAATITLQKSDNLATKVADAANGDVIDLGGGIFTVGEDSISDALPWVINKSVTIQNGSVMLRRGGIILGANVTFDDVEFGFLNRVRNVIAANGYTLTLKSTTSHNSTIPYHLFCGGMSGLSNMPESGEKGTVIITGKVETGNIYAGAISADGNNAISSINAEINVNVETGSIIGTEYNNTKKGIYSTGALEFFVDTDEILNPDYVVGTPQPSTSHAVSGSVSITVNSGTATNIDGATGSAKNAAVVLNDSTGNQQTITLNNVDTLNVAAGEWVPSATSDLSNTSVSVSNSAELVFSNITNPVVKNFESQNGILSLGQEQTLTITGTVSGQAKVAIGGLAYDGASSSSLPTLDHTYISTVDSSNVVFLLYPYASSASMGLIEENNEWIAKSILVSGAKITSIYLEDHSIHDSILAYIPVTVTGLKNDEYLSDIAAIIKINDVELSRMVSVFGYYYENDDLEVMFSFNDKGDALLIQSKKDNSVIDASTYNISVEIPTANMDATAQSNKADCTLTVTSTVPLTFADSDNYNIPASTIGTAITNINVAPAVIGGTKPYTFSATGLPAGISISEDGVISGIPTTAAPAGTAIIKIVDNAQATKEIEINYGAITAAAPPTTESTTKPTESTNAPTSESTNKPTESTSQPTTQSTNKPTESTNNPTTESTGKPTESTNNPTTESTGKPTESTNNPTTESTGKPTEGTNSPSSETINKTEENTAPTSSNTPTTQSTTPTAGNSSNSGGSSGSSNSSTGSSTSVPKNQSKIETKELTEVPESLSKIYSSIDELKNGMLTKVEAVSGYTKDNTVFYDVKLHFSTDGGQTWVEATEENFPAEGITVTFDYPNGTGKNTHDFLVTHMFTVTSEKLGTKAGDMEQPTVTKLDNGIQVTFKGLSPVAISWKDAEVASPKTADDTKLILWAISMCTSGALFLLTAYAKKVL